MSFGIKEDGYARKQYKPEEIIAKLRQVDVLVSQGQSMADAIRQIGVSEVTGTSCSRTFKHSSRSDPLNVSMKALSVGLLGREKSICAPL